MRTFMNAILRLAVTLGSLTILLVRGPIPILADEVVSTATILGGPLSMAASAGPNFAASLTGVDVSSSATMGIEVNDRRGTGDGWHLEITSSVFSTGGADPKTLPPTATSITGVTSACARGTCTNAVNQATFPLTVPAGLVPPTGVKFFDAALNTGMGDFTLTPTFRLYIPANTFAGSYSSTMTITVASAP